jgi:hypothetical protein
MADQRARKCRPSFFRHFNGARNKQLVVRIHGRTSNIQDRTSNVKLSRRAIARSAIQM